MWRSSSLPIHPKAESRLIILVLYVLAANRSDGRAAASVLDPW